MASPALSSHGVLRPPEGRSPRLTQQFVVGVRVLASKIDALFRQEEEAEELQPRERDGGR